MSTSWLQNHLETFVEPYLGFIPQEGESKTFSAEQMSVIKSCWKGVKSSARGRKILLAGRDVFIFEVLARRENYPTLFLPECSRASVSAIKLEEKNLFLFDTGFMGTIPMRLQIQNFCLLSSNIRDNKTQVFPTLTQSRGLALKIEGTPKYWETARIVDGVPFQKLSGVTEFERAARLTMEVYKNSAPKFIDKRKPIGGERWAML